MITFLTENFNSISQKSYDDYISGLQIHQLQCPCCGHSGTMIKHGTYKRHIDIDGRKLYIRIQRIRCKCKKTHALIPASIVPYSGVMLWAHVFIAVNGCRLIPVTKLMNAGVDIDERTVRYIYRNYVLHWKQRIISFRIDLSPLHALTEKCLEYFKRQFMQIRCTPNIFFMAPT